MLTPKSDRSSDGSYPYAKDFKSDLFESAKFGASQPTLTRNSTPFHMNATALSTTLTPHDIRATCQAAQSRIMRLQQATNNQVGLTSAIRDMWFEELRHIAQGFIAAQQASAKLEQAFNTERAQLQGSLSSALNERDLRAAERDSLEQEVKFFRARVSELLSQLYENGNVPDYRINNALSKSSDSWLMTATSSSTGNSPETTRYAAAIPHQSSKVAETLISPQSITGTSTPFGNGNFAAFDQGPTSAPNQNYQHRSNTPHTGGGRYRSQSKFFAKNSGGALVQRPPSAYGNSSGHSTPDFMKSGLAGGRFSRTPGHGTNGPFNVPPLPHAAQQQLKLTPAPMSKELDLFRNDNEVSGDFAPGVPMQPGSGDEERVCDIFQFFNSIKDWVNKYCGFPNLDAMHALSHQHPHLWDYACSVTYPNNRHNAASHLLFMLCNRTFRSFFITRLIIQYVVQQMWSPQAWEGLDDQLTEVLESVKHRLDLKYGYDADAVLQPHERHALVEKRSRAIFDFMHQPNWNKCKSLKISQALTRFKDVVVPMMNMETIEPQNAHRELTGICEDALRLSAILNTSRLSFQFIFNECGIKFSEQSHRALNSNIPARELQAHHWRLMCVVTPGITYRNDAGVSVDPRFLAKANVLLMQ
ncbi:hypothetical protein SEPCBS57363_000804 [Sporothrix epigloea]|uniref:Uncharacterized protein n=1 Tax=Sporothrix epigloea TaxID=1892477 RepID=A0ABP0D6Q9_9PEZI